MEQVPSEVFQLISQYLSQQDLSQLSQVSRRTKSNVKTYQDKISNFIAKQLEEYSMDQLIFGIADGSIQVDDPNHVIRSSQVLDYLLKNKKYSNNKEVNQFVKNLIRFRYSPSKILARILNGFGLIPATRYIEGFEDSDMKKQLVKELGVLYQKLR
jgi:hypothetical protein